MIDKQLTVISSVIRLGSDRPKHLTLDNRPPEIQGQHLFICVYNLKVMPCVFNNWRINYIEKKAGIIAERSKASVSDNYSVVGVLS